MQHTLVAAGEAGVYIYFGSKIDLRINRTVHAAAAQLREMRFDGVRDIVPGYVSLYVELDGRHTTFRDVQRAIDELPEIPDSEIAPASLVEIPVCYGSIFGPDLEQLAAESQLTTQEVIDIHCGRDYDVFFIGFTPGFAFMGVVDVRIAKPRLAQPRQVVPAGSVGIAGNQAGVYPVESPGGWRLIGMTPLRMVDLSAAEPDLLLQPGWQVRFVPISEREFEQLRQPDSL